MDNEKIKEIQKSANDIYAAQVRIERINEILSKIRGHNLIRSLVNCVEAFTYPLLPMVLCVDFVYFFLFMLPAAAMVNSKLLKQLFK